MLWNSVLNCPNGFDCQMMTGLPFEICPNRDIGCWGEPQSVCLPYEFRKISTGDIFDDNREKYGRLEVSVANSVCGLSEWHNCEELSDDVLRSLSEQGWVDAWYFPYYSSEFSLHKHPCFPQAKTVSVYHGFDQSCYLWAEGFMEATELPYKWSDELQALVVCTNELCNFGWAKAVPLTMRPPWA